MTKLSFRRSPTRVYPALSSLIRFVAFLGACIGLVCMVAACGGSSSTSSNRIVRAAAFTFVAPSGWLVARKGRVVSVSPKKGAPELISASVFPLVHPYRPSLFAKTVPELDRTAHELAGELLGKVTSSGTTKVAGIPSRQYELAFKHDSSDLRARITFVLRGKTEYQLFCQWQTGQDEPAACGRLAKTFRPT